MKINPKALPGTLLVLLLLFFGFLAGGLLGGRVFNGGQIGFDALANALGGMMIGVVVGLALGIGMVVKLTKPRLWQATGAVLVAVLLLIGLVRVLESREDRTSTEEVSSQPDRDLLPKPTAPAE